MDRHTTLELFREMFDCLTAISNNEGNESKTMTDAFGLLCAISCFTIIATFHVNRCMFVYTVGLSKLHHMVLYFSTSNAMQMRSTVISTRRHGQHCWDSDLDLKALWKADHGNQRGGRHSRYLLVTSCPTICRPSSRGI